MNSDRDSEHRRYDRNRDVHSNEDRRENFKRDRGNNIRDNFRRSRSRSPKRSDSRDRKRGEDYILNYFSVEFLIQILLYFSGRAELQPALREDHYGPALSGVEPSPTVVLKGLPSHTTEPTVVISGSRLFV